MTRVLVLYVFHIYNDRVKHFIKNAIFKDENIDFIIISNDTSININVPDYVKIIYRDNVGYDFGGWSDALLTHNLYKNYDHFIFANSSIIGPYMPSYYKGKWTDIYIDGLKDNVKLFGSTINTCNNPYVAHVQSYIFAMDKTTLEYLITCGIFSMTDYAKTMEDAIWKREVPMSRKIIENNWNIGSLLPYYNGIDFTFQNKKPHECNIKFLDCFMNRHNRNVSWSDNQLVFIKGNRDFIV